MGGAPKTGEVRVQGGFSKEGGGGLGGEEDRPIRKKGWRAMGGIYTGVHEYGGEKKGRGRA